MTTSDGTQERDGTRERIVKAAMVLFRADGYHATGLAKILERAGANSGSLYHFFKSKRDLLLAVLDCYTELLWPVVIQPVFDRFDDPIERVFGILAGYREMLILGDYKLGCPIGDLALELGDSDPAVRERIALNFANWCKAIKGCLIELAERQSVDVDVEELSQFVLTAMEGAVMQARAHKSLEPFDSSVAQLRRYFDLLFVSGDTARAR